MRHTTEKTRHTALKRSLWPLLTLLLMLSGAQRAEAQWTAPDAGGNTGTTGAGRVGVGIATPSKGKLHVSLEEGVAAGEHGMIYASKPDATGGVYMGYRANGTAVTGGYFRSTANLPLFLGTNAAPEAMVITNAGDISIGSAPTKGSRFEVHADRGVAAGEHGLIYASRGGAGTGGVYLGYRANGTAATGGYVRGLGNMPLFIGTAGMPEAMIISDGGNVGIGTTTPDFVGWGSSRRVLTIRGFGERGVLELANPSTGVSGVASSIVGMNGTARLAQIDISADGAPDSGSMQFYTWNAGVYDMRLKIDRSGNLGVGTAAPAAKLHVAGDIRVDGNINAKYQDVAEWVPSTQKLAAGTVVILDPERNNHVLASTTSYDTAVAGVVSEKPGLSLGEAGEGKALIATTGRVKVKVDATRGAIKIGDLIVTSDVAGVAMKSEPFLLGGRKIHAPGTIIGKALEPLASGKGEILVLLSLQ